MNEQTMPNVLSRETIEALTGVATACFQMNRFWDRAVSELSTKLGCPNVSKKIHHEVAHLFPKLADKVNEILENYQENIIYDMTAADVTSYTNPAQIFTAGKMKLLALRKQINLAANIADENMDRDAANKLDDVLDKISDLIGLIMMWRSKLQNYGEDLGSFDSDFAKFSDLGKLAVRMKKQCLEKISSPLTAVRRENTKLSNYLKKQAKPPK